MERLELGNVVTLATTTSQDRTDINVAYEQQSGEALVVFEDDTNSSRRCFKLGTDPPGADQPLGLSPPPEPSPDTHGGRHWLPILRAIGSCSEC